jgi:transcriptional regulator with XRE-family HTH domain
MVYYPDNKKGLLMAGLTNERLQAVRKAMKLSQRDFSKVILSSQSYLARMEQGKIKINDRIIELVCIKYKVNKAYLKEGKGPMFSTHPDNRLEILNDIYNELNSLFKDYLLVQAKELLKVQKRAKSEEKRLP